MIESINNVFDRIGEIQSKIKSFSQFQKSDKIKEFEELLTRETGTARKGNRITEDSKKAETNVKTLENTVDLTLTQIDKKLEQASIDDAIKKASLKYNISTDLIRAVIKTESAFDPQAVSRAGAMGLMQLMPQTALELGVDRPFDIYENIDGGVKYLKKMLDKYDNNLENALAAYNAGPHNVDLAGGIPDFKETQDYVKKIKTILY